MPFAIVRPSRIVVKPARIEPVERARGRPMVDRRRPDPQPAGRIARAVVRAQVGAVAEPRQHLAARQELDPIGQRDDEVAVDRRVRTPDHGVEVLDRVGAVVAVNGAALDVDPGEDAVVEPRAFRERHRTSRDYL